IAIAEREGSSYDDITFSLWRMLAYCSANKTPPENAYEEVIANAHGRISRTGMIGSEELALKLENGRCPALDANRLVAVAYAWLEATPSNPKAHAVWRTRYNLARVEAAMGDFAAAARLADKAWKDSHYNNGVGILAFQVNASLGNWQECQKIFQRLENARGGNLKLNRALDAFERALREQGL